MKENYVADIKLRVDSEMKRMVLERAAEKRTSEASIVRQALDCFLGITPPPPTLSEDPKSYGKKASALLKQGAKALEKAQFTVEEEIATLIRHFRDVDPGVSLRAHARLRAVLRETAMASGLLALQEIRGTQESDGKKVEVSRAGGQAPTTAELTVDRHVLQLCARAKPTRHLR
jgi:hypothetical protein